MLPAPPGIILSWFLSNLLVATIHYQAADPLPCGMFALIVAPGRLHVFSVILLLVVRLSTAYVT